MTDKDFPRQQLARITASVHQRIAGDIITYLENSGVQVVIEQGGRCVRQVVKAPRWWFPWQTTSLQDSPMKAIRFTVPVHAEQAILNGLIHAGNMTHPGRGAVFSQNVVEYNLSENRRELDLKTEMNTIDPPTVFRDLSLITIILSSRGKGDLLAGMIIEFGAGVPLVTHGIGMGTRDRMNILRITISPDKEIVQVIVPAHDAKSIMRLIIETAGLNQPGGGFIYQTPIRVGSVDSMMRIGRQEHPASIEQIIAAIDDIKGTTSWRRRFVGLDELSNDSIDCSVNPHHEISFICSEGKADQMVQSAIMAGGGAATVSRVGRVMIGEKAEGIAAQERGVLCVPSAVAESVTLAILTTTSEIDRDSCRVQTLQAPAVFSHHRQKAA